MINMVTAVDPQTTLHEAKCLSLRRELPLDHISQLCHEAFQQAQETPDCSIVAYEIADLLASLANTHKASLLKSYFLGLQALQCSQDPGIKTRVSRAILVKTLRLHNGAMHYDNAVSALLSLLDETLFSFLHSETDTRVLDLVLALIDNLHPTPTQRREAFNRIIALLNPENFNEFEIAYYAKRALQYAENCEEAKTTVINILTNLATKVASMSYNAPLLDSAAFSLWLNGFEAQDRQMVLFLMRTIEEIQAIEPHST